MLDTIISQAPRFFTSYTLVFILEAMGRTLMMTLIGCSVGIVAGFVLTVIRTTTGRWMLPLRVLATLYVEIFRRIPFLVILFIVMYGSQGFGANISLTSIATLGICLVASAFLAEIIRAGLESVPRPQLEAALVMNLGFFRTLFRVTLPQAWKVILPPAFAFMVMFIKDTSLASQMGVVELAFTGKILMSRGYSPFLVYGVILAAYFALSYPLSRFGAYLETRLATSRSRKSIQRLRANSGAEGRDLVGGPR